MVKSPCDALFKQSVFDMDIIEFLEGVPEFSSFSDEIGPIIGAH